jgi:hypothetical protein
MKMMVITCGVWPSEDVARRKMWIFMRSCEKFGVDPVLYGGGTPSFPGYRAMKLDMQLEFLKGVKGYTHVMYTDGWDAFFVAHMDEVVEKYEGMGRPPMLVAAFNQLSNVSDADKDYPGCFDERVMYRYPHVGGYIGEVGYVIEMFERMNRLTNDDCFSWYDGWKEGWFRPELDHGCQVFQVTDEHLVMKDGRVFNTEMGSFPCVLHLSGGYTDPGTGKDDRMLPWAKRAGVL